MLTERPGPALREMIHAGSIHMECNNNSSRSAVAYITRMAKANEQKDIKCNTPSDTHSQREKRQDTHFYLPVFSCSFFFFSFFTTHFLPWRFSFLRQRKRHERRNSKEIYIGWERRRAAQPRIYSAGSNQFCEYDQASAVHPILCLYSWCWCCCCWVKNFVPSFFPRLLFSTSLITERRRRLLDYSDGSFLISISWLFSFSFPFLHFV